MNTVLILFALVCLGLCDAQVTIGSFRTLDHGLKGDITAIDDRTFEIRNLIYDGQGPAAFFWVGTGDAVSRTGFAVPFLPECGKMVLPAYNGETVRVELPVGTSVRDIDYLSVWCERFDANFGDVFIPDAAKAAVAPATAPRVCGGGDGAGTFPVQEGWNCETLNPLFQVRWKVSGENINFELVGKVTPSQWMSFGVSGSQTTTQMIDSDVVITNEGADGKFFARDYFMSTREQCANGAGVCRDTVFNPPGVDDVTAVSGNRTLDTARVLFTRPFGAANGATDRAFRAGNVPTYVSWAFGPYNSETDVPQFHRDELSFPTGPVSFVMSRTPINNCETPIQAEAVVEEIRLAPWTRPSFSNVTDFTARIGPSGGNHGVTAITADDSWGIAWYISETGKDENILIPAIAVERGVTYTFRVFGGNNPNDGTPFHPMYITNDPEGGLSTKGPAARVRETIYAGITNIVRNETGIHSFDTPANGPICEIKVKPGSKNPDTVDTFEAWSAEALDFSCQNTTRPEQAGILEWTVPENLTESEVYYQCATHTDLGFKLVVFDKGAVDQDVLNSASIVARTDTANGTAAGSCKAQFKGAEVEYQGCQTDNPDIQVYWNIVDTNIETMYVSKSDGWAGLGWGTSSMVPADAVIGYIASNGSVLVDDFGLTGRNVAGVTPAGKQNITNAEGESRNGEIAVRFTRPLSGLDPAGEASLIYAVGPLPQNAPQLPVHSKRESITVNLAARGASAGSGGGGLNRGAFFLSHGIMMIIAWAFLTPLAVVIMRFFKKHNPTTFKLHSSLNGLSVVVVLVAFLMAIIKGSHTRQGHMIIGILVTVFAVIQSVLGGIRPGKEAPTRKIWFMGHAWLGRVVLILGWVNIFIGMKIQNLPNPSLVIVGIIMAVFLALSIVLSFLPGKFPITEEITARQESGEDEKLQ